MVMFVMTIAVMSIMMGVAVQTAEFQMRREREAELIFRGQQFIEAIRLYKIKYGRYPMQLKEIYEAKPRVVRKQWKDPITDSENWGIVFLGQEGQQLGQGGRQLAGPGAQDDVFGRKPVGTETPFGTGSRNQNRGNSADGKPGGKDAFGNDLSDQGGFGQVGADRKMGPIIGVHSLSCDEAIKIYEGHTTYCEWRFIFREQQQRGGQRGQQRPGSQPVGWHPGDEVKPGTGGPGGGGTGSGSPRGPRSPGGGRPPQVQTPPVP